MTVETNRGSKVRRARWLGAIAVCASAVGLAALLGAAMTPPVMPLPATTTVLEPTEQENYVARRVSDIVAREHYRRAPLDDRLSSLILDRYLDAVDSNRSYFYASDIAEFEKYRYQLDDAIKAGDVEPAFVIFRRFQQRSRERMNYAIELLSKKPDFDLDESFNFDREKEPWPANTAEMNELWRKRVKNDELSLLITGKQWPEVVDILRKRYEHVAKRMDQSKPEDVFEAFMNAFVLSLDPHSNYFSARNSEEYNIQMSLSYEGIGASLQLTDDYVTVIDVIAGGPAAVSGKLSANDRITAVGEGKTGEMTDVIGWRLDDVVQKIRGPGGTQVRLQILPAGAAPGSAQKVVEFTRNRISLEAQASHKALRTVQRNGRDVKIGIITVPSFYQDYDASRAGAKDFRSTTRDVQRLIGELRKEGAEALIMDLRGNGGGYLPEAESLTGLFIDRGPVVQLRDTTGRIEVDDDPDPAIFYSGPLIVLVDRFSASASEIFAGAIQDYGRGLIVGQQTYGKGTVQNAHPLNYTIFGRKPELGQLNVTIGKYYRITGESTQDRGVTPDITIPSLIDASEVGESTRDRALPWDHIEPAAFKAEGDLKPVAAMLEKLHEQRTAGSPDFRYLSEDIAALDTIRSQKTVSLNLKTREAERKRMDAERLDRENALRIAHGEPPYKSLDEIKDDAAAGIILDETTQIAADFAVTSAHKEGPTQARRTEVGSELH
ncbi:MAG TPA: carboxy terminal-processing peptidase [Steroidobacteraceae bacterium]|nr:carboxy terminal-processing peptidase [Steroidobacteraceae bacterium]